MHLLIDHGAHAMIDINMRRKIGILLITLGLITFVVIGARFVLSKQAPKTGVLKINSNPVSSIFLNDVHVGRTPYEDTVAAGEYTVKLVPESVVEQATSWQGKTKVAPNLLTYINRDLSSSELQSAGEVLWLERITSNSSELTVTTIPDGASVLLDEQTKGTTPLTITDVSPGDHSLVVTSPGFVTRTLKIRSTAGYKLNSSIQLALSPLGDVKREDEDEATTSGELEDEATGSADLAQLEKPYVIISDTPTGFLRVRADATITAEELGLVNPGEEYSIIDAKDGWYQIQFDDEEVGWVSGQYVEVVE